MGKILEKLMKKYWKNVKNTGKVYEKILEKCKINWKSQGNSSVQKSGNHDLLTDYVMMLWYVALKVNQKMCSPNKEKYLHVRLPI